LIIAKGLLSLLLITAQTLEETSSHSPIRGWQPHPRHGCTLSCEWQPPHMDVLCKLAWVLPYFVKFILHSNCPTNYTPSYHLLWFGLWFALKNQIITISRNLVRNLGFWVPM
jgi:hypothetical protein